MLTPPCNTDTFTIKLKWNKEKELHPSLLHLDHKLAQQYKNLPWPYEISRVTLMTETPGGRGDIAAAGKVIGILQKEHPSLDFNWAIPSLSTKLDPVPFLNDRSRVNIESDLHGKVSDLIIIGPASCGWDKGYMESKIGTIIKGPRFSFREAGSKPSWLLTKLVQNIALNNSSYESKALEIHKNLFDHKFDGICMGLIPGSGIFFDQSRIDTELSRGYCCPKPLLDIKDDSLRQDILKSLSCQDDGTLPDFDQFSLNSGYAHRPSSWGKFIDFVAIQEQEKHVTIVLNHHGEFDRPTIDQYCTLIFTPKRLQFLKQCGYGKIVLKGAESKELALSEDSGRNLSIIVRPSFTPNDMKQLQLASERLIATGMNTPAESWASKCKLYVYENVANFVAVKEFLAQQIKVANTINPKLGRFLRLAGDRNEPLNEDEMAEAATLLCDPELTSATLIFCDHVTANYRFEDAFLGSLKREIWHHYIPKLAEIEVDSIGDEFKGALIKYLSSFDAEKQVMSVNTLSLLSERVHFAVSEHLENFSLTESQDLAERKAFENFRLEELLPKNFLSETKYSTRY